MGINKVNYGNTTLIDTSNVTVTADKLMQGYTALDNTGTLITGTATGGGGSGLEYETGTWTPSADVESAWISFANTHTVAPFYYALSDTTSTVAASKSNGGVLYSNFAQGLGEPLHISATGLRYGYARKFMYTGSHATSLIGYPYTDTGDSSTSYSRYWAKETGIKAEPYSSGYYWRAGRTYKWIAVWKPTT